MTEEELIQEIQKLPREALGRLRDALNELYSESEPEIEDYFIKAALLRYEAIKAGHGKTVPIEEVLEKAQKYIDGKFKQSLNR